MCSSVLCTAIGQGGYTVVLQLIATGRVDVNARCECGLVPLARALRQKHEPIIRLLLSHGARVDIAESDEVVFVDDPPELGLGPAELTILSSAFHTATELDDMTPLSLLLDCGLDVESREDGRTLLMRAAWASAPLTAFLLERGADPNAKSDDGWTALMYAVDVDGGFLGLRGEDPAEVVAMLLRHGADVHARNPSGYTALEIFRGQRRRGEYGHVERLLGEAAEDGLR